jgi:hypothetical protein
MRAAAALLLVLAAQASLYAKCPVSGPTTLIVRAPIGNLQVDTTGRDAVDVQVNNGLVQVQEKCGRDSIEITGNTGDVKVIQGTVDWRIIVPRHANLDLVTLAGSINVGDSDGNVVLRTTGGSVIAGQIKGNAAIITQGGSIKSGNIGGNAELRSQGGSLEVGDVAGDAEFQTAGPIRAGGISGGVVADTAGGTIAIREVRGDVKATTKAGDISIGDAARIYATTAGGNITSQRVRGPFQGRTESGDIRLESAAAWVEASTGFGNIFVKMVPENLEGDLHVNLQSGIGDVTIFLPQRMKASVEATVERPAFSAQRIISDFPMNAAAANARKGIVPNKFYAPTQSQTILNGGGNRIILHTSLGKIEIKKQ